MKRLWYYYIYLLLAWGCVRYFARFPEVIDELWIKPVLWLVPLFWWNLSFHERVVMFGKKWMSSVMWGVLIGIMYFSLFRLMNRGAILINLDIFFIALATATTEELVFSGFVVGYLDKVRRDRVGNLLIVGVMVAVVRLPILLFVYHVGGVEMAGVMLVAFSSGVINAWIRLRSGNVFGSILARLGMNLATIG